MHAAAKGTCLTDTPSPRVAHACKAVAVPAPRVQCPTRIRGGPSRNRRAGCRVTVPPLLPRCGCAPPPTPTPPPTHRRIRRRAGARPGVGGVGGGPASPHGQLSVHGCSSGCLHLGLCRVRAQLARDVQWPDRPRAAGSGRIRIGAQPGRASAAGLTGRGDGWPGPEDRTQPGPRAVGGPWEVLRHVSSEKSDERMY